MLFWATDNNWVTEVAIFNSSTVIVGVVVLESCLNKNPPNVVIGAVGVSVKSAVVVLVKEANVGLNQALKVLEVKS